MENNNGLVRARGRPVHSTTITLAALTTENVVVPWVGLLSAQVSSLADELGGVVDAGERPVGDALVGRLDDVLGFAQTGVPWQCTSLPLPGCLTVARTRLQKLPDDAEAA